MTIAEAKHPTPFRLMHIESPSLTLWENLLSAQECDALIEAARPRMARVFLTDDVSGEKLPHPIKQCEEGTLEANATAQLDALCSTIDARIHEQLGDIPETLEGWTILHYGPQDRYKTHCDYLDERLSFHSHEIKTKGQRAASIFIYLNDVEEGGETHFPEIKLKIKPLKGHAILFYNGFNTGDIDARAAHESLPVIRGEKWVAVKSLRLGKESSA